MSEADGPAADPKTRDPKTRDPKTRDPKIREAQIREATIADVPRIVPLIESAYRGDSSRGGWTTEADLLDGQRTDEADVTAAVTDAGSRMILAEDGDDLLACCLVQHRGTYAYFGMFAVSPTSQGTGLGKRVLAVAEDLARDDLGLTTMHMTVIRQRADLIAWYVRRGYKQTGEMRPFPYGDLRFGKPRRDDLEFEVLVKELV
nr:GNAT family N-acetyltransferase [Catenulispora acidiphila]